VTPSALAVRDCQAQRLNALAEYNGSGMRWIFHRHIQPPSVVIDIVNIQGVTAGKTKDHSPVRPHRHRPKALERSLEWMKPKPRQVHCYRVCYRRPAPQKVRRKGAKLTLYETTAAVGKLGLSARNLPKAQKALSTVRSKDRSTDGMSMLSNAAWNGTYRRVSGTDSLTPI
jgi:hypothetical protein